MKNTLSFAIAAAVLFIIGSFVTPDIFSTIKNIDIKYWILLCDLFVIMTVFQGLFFDSVAIVEKGGKKASFLDKWNIIFSLIVFLLSFAIIDFLVGLDSYDKIVLHEPISTLPAPNIPSKP
ncbi:hypothetical protein ACQZV8_04775 [Magnetococcales bacterium HHB-1]